MPDAQAAGTMPSFKTAGPARPGGYSDAVPPHHAEQQPRTSPAQGILAAADSPAHVVWALPRATAHAMAMNTPGSPWRSVAVHPALTPAAARQNGYTSGSRLSRRQRCSGSWAGRSTARFSSVIAGFRGAGTQRAATINRRRCRTSTIVCRSKPALTSSRVACETAVRTRVCFVKGARIISMRGMLTASVRYTVGVRVANPARAGCATMLLVSMGN